MMSNRRLISGRARALSRGLVAHVLGLSGVVNAVDAPSSRTLRRAGIELFTSRTTQRLYRRHRRKERKDGGALSYGGAGARRSKGGLPAHYRPRYFFHCKISQFESSYNEGEQGGLCAPITGAYRFFRFPCCICRAGSRSPHPQEAGPFCTLFWSDTQEV